MTTAYYLRGAVHGVIMQCRALSDVKPGHPAPDALVSYTLENAQPLHGALTWP